MRQREHRMQHSAWLKPKSYRFIVLALVFVLLLCVVNISYLLSRSSNGLNSDPVPFLLLPTTEGFTNNYLNINDAWEKFTKRHGRRISILRTRVSHYGDMSFCVGDYLQLPPGVECSPQLADRALLGAGLSTPCVYPRPVYQDISWYVNLADSWLSVAADVLPSNATVRELPGVRVTEASSWDYLRESCGLYRFTDYHFSPTKSFPLHFQPRIMDQFTALRERLVTMDASFKVSSFAVVHWRRGDEESRYFEGDRLPLNCRGPEHLVHALQHLQRQGVLPSSVYISTNEQNVTSLAHLAGHGFVTFNIFSVEAALRGPTLPALDPVELFLFELNLMATASVFVYFGNSKVPLLVGRLMRQRGQPFDARSFSVSSAADGAEEYASALVKRSGDKRGATHGAQ